MSINQRLFPYFVVATLILNGTVMLVGVVAPEKILGATLLAVAFLLGFGIAGFIVARIEYLELVAELERGERTP
jgi:hypothetical protein